MSKINKNKVLILLLVKVLIFVCVLYFFYLQLQKIHLTDISNFTIENLSALILTIVLAFLNLFLEFLKWDNSLKVLHLEITVNRKFASFMSGLLTGFLTPNLIGNFIGRMFYFRRRNRISITFLTLISNSAQFTASMFFGLLGILLLGLPQDFKFLEISFVEVILVLVLTLLVFFYFFQFHLATFFFSKKIWMQRVNDEVENKSRYLFSQLLLSLSRHLVFSLQYFLLFVAFGITPKLELLFYIWQIYFWSTLIPSLWLGKLFIRESVALWIMAQVIPEIEIVLLSSVLLWAINQGLPALIGVPYFKFTKRKNV